MSKQARKPCQTRLPHNESAEEPIKVRIRLNAGEPIAEDDDLFGTAVNLAARIFWNTVHPFLFKQ